MHSDEKDSIVWNLFHWPREGIQRKVRWPRLVGQLGGLFKVYSDCHSYRQNLLGQIFLSLLLRL